jgi:hypothetical protein
VPLASASVIEVDLVSPEEVGKSGGEVIHYRGCEASGRCLSAPATVVTSLQK